MLDRSNQKQLSLEFKQTSEILRFKPNRSQLSKETVENLSQLLGDRPSLEEIEQISPEARPKKSLQSKVKIGAFDSSVATNAIANDLEDKKPVIKGEKLELEAQQPNPISEIIKELTIDLRHEKLISNADWSESSTVDLEHFNYSADYSAFLSSYE